MQRVVYVRFEYRDNAGFPIKTIERITVLEDKEDPGYLSETLATWASETAKTLATVISLTKADLRKLRQNHARSVIS